MKVKFSELRKMDVISVTDGKNLGRVCDVTLRFPENDVLGITAAGGKGFRFNKQEVFLPVNTIVKIGEDVVLTNVNDKKPPQPAPHPSECCKPGHGDRRSDGGRRNFEEYE